MHCTRCDGTGFVDLGYVPIEVVQEGHDAVLAWMGANPDSDVRVCDCCGDGESKWHGEPGQHDRGTFGMNGPYASNGGFPRCV